MKGTVKFFDNEKHFGFIAADDGKEYFVHESALQGITIAEGDEVEFDVTQGDRGPKADKVRSPGAAEAPAESDDSSDDSEDSSEDSGDDSDDSSDDSDDSDEEKDE